MTPAKRRKATTLYIGSVSAMGATEPWPLPFALDSSEERARWTEFVIARGRLYVARGQPLLQVPGPASRIEELARQVGAGSVQVTGRASARWEARGAGLVGSVARAMWSELERNESPLIDGLRTVAWRPRERLCAVPECPGRQPPRMRCCALHAQLLTRTRHPHPAMLDDLVGRRRCWCGGPTAEETRSPRRSGLCSVCLTILAATTELARVQRAGWDRDTWQCRWPTLALPGHEADPPPPIGGKPDAGSSRRAPRPGGLAPSSLSPRLASGRPGC
jgi:hypothetical protein